MTDKEEIINELKEVLDSLDITNEYRLNLIKAIEYLQEEPVSDDLEKEIEESWKHLDLSFIESGYEMFKVRNIVSDIAHHFTYWKKQQMMKDAISCKLCWYDGFYLDYTEEELYNVIGKRPLEVGDVLKLIIISED